MGMSTRQVDNGGTLHSATAGGLVDRFAVALVGARDSELVGARDSELLGARGSKLLGASAASLPLTATSAPGTGPEDGALS